MLKDRLPKNVALSVACADDCAAKFDPLTVGDRVQIAHDAGVIGTVQAVIGPRHFVEWDIPASVRFGTFMRDELRKLP
ncbi:hypothetical protein [Nevskia ramosa]|uniref:hypothetical protein n=1 Tax=Nevskia ramosa TaxID=64002 RepID=UPI003D0D51C3